MFNRLGPSSACAILALLAATPADAASIKSQGPCPLFFGICQAFQFDTAIPVITSYAFKMPAAGTAMVSFDGTMQCTVNSTVLNTDVVDLGSQIVTSAAATADYMGPGGNRYAMRLHFGNLGSSGPSATMNLAATRTIKYTTGGTKEVFYKFLKNRMDSGSGCTVYAMTFSVLIAP